jgi:hypothetical protein
MKSKFSVAVALGVCSLASFMSIFFPSMDYFVINNIKIINDYVEYYEDDTTTIQSEGSSACSVAGKDESVGENDEEPGECVEGKPDESDATVSA